MANNNHKNSNECQLGHFINHSIWNDAQKLIDYQISLKPKNKHFNTLSLFYYEKLKKAEKNNLITEEYFNTKISNNLFYGLEKEFSILTYPIPKSNLGLRKYSFFTFPMRVVYYAVGIYLICLSQEFVNQYYKTHNQIFSEYGGNLTVDEKTLNLNLSYDSVWYKPYYKKFREKIRSEVSENFQNKIIIHIDIQNYFEEISIPRLLNFLAFFIKPSIQKQLNFDPITIGQIIAFFEFISNGGKGIPQNDNDIVSSYLGHLYLVFGDLFIDQEMKKYSKNFSSYSINRYMDDMYISIDFLEESPKTSREILIASLAARIADCLYQNLGLRLNTKTKLFWLCDENDINDLIKNIKKVSQGYDYFDDQSKNDMFQKKDLIIEQLNKLKKASLDPTFDASGDLEDEIFKEVYNNSLFALLNTRENKRIIKEIFTDFNFDLVLAQPREILIILLIDEDASKKFEKFLLSKKELSSRDIYLILTYLCQIDFSSKKLITLLKKNNSMTQIMNYYTENSISSNSPGYYHLSNSQILVLCNHQNIIEQIRLRINSERRYDFSTGLNHLLNEIHAICEICDPNSKNIRKYEAGNVIDYLKTQKVPHETCVKIRNLFDRRNKNPVSHADPISWPVSEVEYRDYHKHVGICLSFIGNNQ